MSMPSEGKARDGLLIAPIQMTGRFFGILEQIRKHSHAERILTTTVIHSGFARNALMTPLNWYHRNVLSVSV